MVESSSNATSFILSYAVFIYEK